jgi:hypothetical protein
MQLKKVVTPVKNGVQSLCNYLNGMASGFSRNDKSTTFQLIAGASNF